MNQGQSIRARVVRAVCGFIVGIAGLSAVACGRAELPNGGDLDFGPIDGGGFPD